MVTRAEWNARPPLEVSLIGHPVNMTFVHHSAGSFCFDKEECIAVVQGIQDFHMDGNGEYVALSHSVGLIVTEQNL